MGVAHLRPICEFFMRRLYAKGKLSIRECVDAMYENGITYDTSAGSCDDKPHLALGMGGVIRFMLGILPTCPPQENRFIELVDPSDKNKKIVMAWVHDAEDAFSPDSMDDEGFFPQLDDLQWKYTKDWRKKYSQIPRLSYIGH